MKLVLIDVTDRNTGYFHESHHQTHQLQRTYPLETIWLHGQLSDETINHFLHLLLNPLKGMPIYYNIDEWNEALCTAMRTGWCLTITMVSLVSEVKRWVRFLEYSDTDQAIRKYVYEEDTQQQQWNNRIVVLTGLTYNNKHAIYISEACLHSLRCGRKKKRTVSNNGVPRFYHPWEKVGSYLTVSRSYAYCITCWSNYSNIIIWNKSIRLKHIY